MYKQLIRDCEYATSAVDGRPLRCDVYVLVGYNERLLFHESLFLCDVSRTDAINTARSYASDLISFARMAHAHGGWSAVNQKIMSGYLHGDLLQNRGFLKSTMTRHIETIKRFYGWLGRKGYVLSGPDFIWDLAFHCRAKLGCGKSSDTNTNSLYLSKSDFLALLSGTFSKNKFIQRRNEIVLRLGYECGLRACEVLGIDSKDLKNRIVLARQKNNGLWAATQIKILGKGSVHRDIYIPPLLCEMIVGFVVEQRSTLRRGEGPLISSCNGDKIENQKFASSVFSDAYRKSGLVRSHRQGYHRLRKSFATNLVDNCYRDGKDPWVEVPRRMGHKNAVTTRSYIQFEALMNGRSEVLSSLAMSDEKYRPIQNFDFIL